MSLYTVQQCESHKICCLLYLSIVVLKTHVTIVSEGYHRDALHYFRLSTSNFVISGIEARYPARRSSTDCFISESQEIKDERKCGGSGRRKPSADICVRRGRPSRKWSLKRKQMADLFEELKANGESG